MKLSDIKRIYVHILIGMMLVAGVVFLIVKLISGTGINKEIIQRVPIDAAVIVDFKSPDILLEGFTPHPIIQSVFTEEGLLKIHKKLLFLDSVFTANNKLKQIKKHLDVSMSIHPIGKSDVGVIWYYQFNNIPNRSEIKSTIESLFGKEQITQTKKYEGVAIFGVTNELIGKQFFYQSGNQLIFSNTIILLENSIRQSKMSLGLNDNKYYKKLKKSSGFNADANIYMQYKSLNKLVSPAVSNSIEKKLINPMTQPVAEWTGFDADIKNDFIVYNGFTFVSDTVTQFLSLFKNQEPSGFNLIQYFPSQTKSFLAYSLNNFRKFSEDYMKYLKSTGYNSMIGNMNEFRKANADVSDLFISNISECIAHVIINVNNIDDKNFLVAKIKSEEIFMQALKNVDNGTILKKGNIIIDNETKFPLYQIKTHDFGQKLLGHLAGHISTPYFIIIDNTLIFNNSDKSLKAYAHACITRNTLTTDVRFKTSENYISTKSNVFFYSDLSENNTLFAPYISNDLLRHIKTDQKQLKNLGSVGVQYQYTGGNFYTNMFMSYLSETIDEPHTVWETLLDTVISFKPVFVENHYTHKKEIFVQDAAHNVYLINDIGRVLWKVNVQEEIMGTVYQADYYKNGKLQYLFTTSSKIHLIDREGNYVEDYPINLRAKATAGLSLFDYESNKDYRIFIPCDNKKVYLYNIEGKLIRGWEFDKAENVVNTEIQHFRQGNKDYIVFADKNLLYILNRRGEVRVPVKKLIKRSVNNTIYFDIRENNTSLFVTTDEQGKVYSFDEEGNTSELFFEEMGPQHYFMLHDLDGDNISEYVFLDKARLVVFNRQKKKIFDYTFDNEIKLAPILFQFSDNDKKIGVVNTEEQQLYLINNNGKLYKGFPLNGNVRFSIGRFTDNQRFNLITGNRNNFLLNYSVK